MALDSAVQIDQKITYKRLSSRKNVIFMVSIRNYITTNNQLSQWFLLLLQRTTSPTSYKRLQLSKE
jgi:hypothetical protein